jgi:2-C-methyl-D-erythritol 2,4-cyclodiphosphate synthase
MMNLRLAGEPRVGYGYDAHRFSPERKLVLCGVEVPFERGLLGHSDADVAVHALIDALLGAVGGGDIGRQFPDDDERYADISSMILLEEVMRGLSRDGFAVGNADVTIIAQKPKLLPHLAAMRAMLAAALRVDETHVNVKATTTERMGFTGRMEGMAASAVALVRRMGEGS